jgi:hypothetical protein
VRTGTFTPTALGGTWSSGPSAGTSVRNNFLSCDEARYQFATDVTLTVQPGKNTIAIRRTTRFDIQVIHWAGIRNNPITIRTQVHLWYAVTLDIVIELKGVQDGKLLVKTSSDFSPKPAKEIVAADPYGWLMTKHEGEYSMWADISGTFDNVLRQGVELAMPQGLLPDIEQEISQALLPAFVFPGGAQLFMNQPGFNDEGDLLLGLSYKS